MQLTPNYKLKKPEGTDPVDIQDLNDNADLIDAAMNYPAASCGVSKVATSTYNPICYTALFSLRFYRLFYNFFPVPVLSHIYL